MKVRVATFNVENLFARYRFRQDFNPVGDDGFSINNLAFDVYDDEAKRITAKAIREVEADIICLQEVENLELLDRFNSRYMYDKKYEHRLVIDSHDPRHIDVAVLSKYPFTRIATHRHERNAEGYRYIFSRDCLEVDIAVEKQTLSLYVNHFKSMIRTRAETKERRVEQVERVAEIIDDQWKKKKYQGNFVVLGDFNDYIDNETSLTALVEHDHLVNVVERLPKDQQWTHYYAGKGQYRQLDYLLLSKALADKNGGKPKIERRGMPWRATKAGDTRFPNVGEDYPKASDHCPLYMDLELI